MNNFYTDKQLETLFGQRGEGTALFEPVELGWLCPEDENHLVTWSAWNQHIWCLDCELDYFTLLCPKRYIRTHPQSQSVVEEEIEKMRPLMKKWTLKKYREMGTKIT